MASPSDWPANFAGRHSKEVRRDSVLVDESFLQFLFQRAKDQRAPDSQLVIQRGSFVIGSAALASNELTRSSIAEIEQDRSLIADENDQTLEVDNLAKQYDFIIAWVRNFLSLPAQSFNLTAELIQLVHKISFNRVSPNAGLLRSGPIQISNSNFSAPPAESISRHLSDLCSYVNRHWTTSSALHLASYVLWRLLWIHPFADGNGRVARAVAYLVLSSRLGAILPGTPTLPELISQNRMDYYAALEAADKAELDGKTNVSAVEELLGRLLSLQLQNIAFLPASSKSQLDQVIGSRIMRADKKMRQSCYGTTEPKYRLWSQGSYLLLYVATDLSIDEARERQFNAGEPFPGLLSTLKESALKHIDNDHSGIILKNEQLNTSQKRALFLSPDASVTLLSMDCRSDTSSYAIEGALYCLRLGPRTTIENCYEAFSFLIARHMRAIA